MGELIGILGGAAGLGALALIFKAWARRTQRDALDDAHTAAQADAAQAFQCHQEVLQSTAVEEAEIDGADDDDLADLVNGAF